MEIDLTPALLGEHNVLVGRISPVQFTVSLSLDSPMGDNMVRINVADSKTGNDANRKTSDGVIVNGDTAKVNIRTIYDLIPGMIEEVMVMNKFMGSKT